MLWRLAVWWCALKRRGQKRQGGGGDGGVPQGGRAHSEVQVKAAAQRVLAMC